MSNRRLSVRLLLALILLLVAGCREAAPPEEETLEEASATPELGEATEVAQATATATATPTAASPPEATATDETLPTATAVPPTATTAPAANTNTPPPTPSATPCGSPPTWVEYTIQQGDTLGRLAQATGTTVAAIQQANCLDSTTLFTGNRLFLPVLPPTPTPEASPTATATPPPPPPLVLNGSQPQGTAPVVGQLTYDNAYLLRIDARRSGGPEEPGWGIDSVEFRVSSSTVSDLYVHTEENPGYCIFGGGEPACNPWPQVDGVYRWGEGGPPVEPGSYFVQVQFNFTLESDDGSGISEGFWSFSFDIGAP